MNRKPLVALALAALLSPGLTAAQDTRPDERSVRLRGEVEARVQRTEEGDLRARIEDVNLGKLSAAQRAVWARELAARASFDRVRIRGTDANGERVRVEFRADRVQRPERMQRAERVERAERPERPE